MLTVLCSAKGAPGVTTASLALAAGWPGDSPVMVVEADPSGGDLGVRMRTRQGALPPAPTVATLAAEARDPRTALVDVAIPVNERLRVVPGFLTPEQGRGMVALWEPLASGLQQSTVDTLVDVGRVSSSSPAMRLLEVADVVVVVVQADWAGLVHARELIRLLAVGRRSVVMPLVITTARNAARDKAEVDEVLAAEQIPAAAAAHLAWDPAAVAALVDSQAPTRRALTRSKLVRSAQAAADAMVRYRSATIGQEAL
jgi:MinD-like ATPase involved in chromosome partitioning or flagellar assembly